MYSDGDVEHLENILRYLCKNTETWSEIQSFIQTRQSSICGTVNSSLDPNTFQRSCDSWKQMQVCTGESGSEQRCGNPFDRP